jgi:hypothetical protein
MVLLQASVVDYHRQSRNYQVFLDDPRRGDNRHLSAILDVLGEDLNAALFAHYLEMGDTHTITIRHSHQPSAQNTVIVSTDGFALLSQASDLFIGGREISQRGEVFLDRRKTCSTISSRIMS